MIAIPLDSKESTTLSKLYGNAPFFALLDEQNGSFKTIPNKEEGNGPKSAEFLKELGISSTIYYHMGEGIYKSFAQNSIDVYSANHNIYTLDEIYNLTLSNSLVKLNESNYLELLDPGDSSVCKCGCN